MTTQNEQRGNQSGANDARNSVPGSQDPKTDGRPTTDQQSQTGARQTNQRSPSERQPQGGQGKDQAGDNASSQALGVGSQKYDSGKQTHR